MTLPKERIQILERELHDRNVEIALLKEIGTAVSSELDLEKVFQLVVELAQSLIKAETLLLPVLDKDFAQYTYRAGCGKHADEIVGESLPLEIGICGWVWRHKHPWWRGVLDELDAEERNKWEKDAGTIILVPLVGKRQFLGGLAGINKIGGGDFTKRDLDLLTLFANHVTFAIENAALFDQMIRARDQAEGYQRELQNLNTELEKRVVLRTTALADAVKELEHLAMHDSLTGLPNRALFQDRLAQGIVMAKRERKSLALIMIDLDKFKEINDRLGHDVGDQMLKETGQRLKHALRQWDTVSRLGGDEFAIVLPATDAAGATCAANKLLKALNTPFMLNGTLRSGPCSMGIAVYPDNAQDADSLYKCADTAMYIAKRKNAGYFAFCSDNIKECTASDDLH